MRSQATTVQTSIEVWDAGAIESDSPRFNSWKARVIARIGGRTFFHRCEHNHRKTETAEQCARTIVAELTEEK